MAFFLKFDIRNISKFQKQNLPIKSAKQKEAILYMEGAVTEIFDSAYSSELKDQEKTALNMYLEKGEGFADSLDGYFFLIIKDKGKLIFINNRYSCTTCYYLIKNNELTVSDSYSEIIKHLDSKELNWDVINLFLNSGYSYSEKMPFFGTFRMLPGYIMLISDGKISHKKYGRFEFNRKSRDATYLLDTYESLWKDAIKNFIKYNSTKNLGSCLSGGLDTSWVVLMASKVFNKKINTFTCYYDFSLFNELKEASYVTKKINGMHNKVKINETDLDLMPEMIKSSEEPVLSSSLSLYKTIKFAKILNVDTFLTGDGGNNIYHHLYPVSEIHKYIKNMPYPVRKSFFYLVDSIAKLTGWERLWEARYPFYAFSDKKFYDNFYKNLTCYRHFDKFQRKSLLKAEYYNEFDETKMLGRIIINKDNFDDALIQSRFVYGNMQYVSAFQEKFAKTNGIRLFPPYQNKKIMDFLTSLPYDLMFRGNTIKKLTNRANKMYFQKLALKRHFPKTFVDKVGQPFDQPFHFWFERKQNLIGILFSSLKKRGWYNNKYMDLILSEHKKQHQHKKIFCQLSNHSYRIMALLSLEIWAKIYLDGKTIKKNRETIEEFLAK